MRTLILALAVVLLAVPAWADVKIIVTDITTDPEKPTAQISYDATTETELVRAFALNITVNDGNIVDINDYAVGDNNGGYGIFPGNFSRFITVNTTTGNVDNWGIAGYTPVADAGDPDAKGGLDTNGVTIEMGALYDDAPPAKTGILCTLVCSKPCLMSVEGNAIRGNVVLEDAAEATLEVTTAATDVQIGSGDCIDSVAYPADYAMWVTLGKPDCWCDPPFGSGYQCYGDADQVDSGFPFKFRIFSGDLTILINNWRKKAGDATLDPCADFDHADSGFPFKFQVFSPDLTILINNWRKKNADFAVTCLP